MIHMAQFIVGLFLVGFNVLTIIVTSARSKKKQETPAWWVQLFFVVQAAWTLAMTFTAWDLMKELMKG